MELVSETQTKGPIWRAVLEELWHMVIKQKQKSSVICSQMNKVHCSSCNSPQNTHKNSAHLAFSVPTILLQCWIS